MYIYHALINALSAHMTHSNLNMIFYTHAEHGPTKTIYGKYYMAKQTNRSCTFFCASNLSPLSTSEEQKKGNWLVTRLLLLPHIFLALFSFVFASYLNSLSTNEEQKNINS